MYIEEKSTNMVGSKNTNFSLVSAEIAGISKELIIHFPTEVYSDGNFKTPIQILALETSGTTGKNKQVVSKINKVIYFRTRDRK